ncbi:urea ABC transporter ATP-binding protein UrtD [Gallibacterium salpingitidis]|uniref:Urea ABC transporter ATP-binding protein n=1 Tax=Gallibacterium salpingitidis TaxID=505341 RepID=A0A1A7NXQ7_9PAST|nr:urea ABC transporter ATP-binding protein UrtD [Gallibacterium salpingitidis]OBW94291.1 urea ABC transporter ATP-binding protein [Gallibacterium salpingitidis]
MKLDHNLKALFRSSAPQKRFANKDIPKNIILYLDSVSVSFDGFKAINNLNLTIDKGELRCIIGPNGAGKTTMMDIITGKTRPDEGSVYLGQYTNLLEMTEAEIACAGIGRKFQKPTVFESLTVYDNLSLAIYGSKSVFATYFGKARKLNTEQNDFLDNVLQIIGLSHTRDYLAGVLSHGQKQWLEIGMLLMQKPQLLLVDEPVTGMTHGEIERTAELLTSLAGEQAIVVVEHDMEFVRQIARKVTVLHQGSVLAEGSLAEIQNNQQVIDVYLGQG